LHLEGIFDDDHGRRNISPRAAISLGDGKAHDAEFGELSQNVVRDVVRLVPRGGLLAGHFTCHEGA
jgi:hypothetical protein